MLESQEGNILNNEEQTQYHGLLEIAPPPENSLMNSTTQHTQRKSERNAVDIIQKKNVVTLGLQQMLVVIHVLCLAAQLTLPSSILPQTKTVFAMYLYMKLQQTGVHGSGSVYECASQVVLQWIYCNVYQHCVATVKTKLEDLYSDYKYL